MTFIWWIVFFMLIGLGKYAIGEIKAHNKIKGILLLSGTVVLLVAWFAFKGYMSRHQAY